MVRSSISKGTTMILLMKKAWNAVKITRLIISAVFLSSITACAGGVLGDSTPATVSSVSTNPGLVGQVTNSNGIRDDVNDYILAEFPDDPKKRIAATRFAQSNQRILEVMADKRPVTQDLVTKTSYAGLCFAKNLDKRSFMKQAREITARTFNTEARFRAHDEFSKQAYGMSVAASDSVNACEAAK
jgi:hypothetical protein